MEKKKSPTIMFGGERQFNKFDTMFKVVEPQTNETVYNGEHQNPNDKFNRMFRMVEPPKKESALDKLFEKIQHGLQITDCDNLTPEQLELVLFLQSTKLTEEQLAWSIDVINFQDATNDQEKMRHKLVEILTPTHETTELDVIIKAWVGWIEHLEKVIGKNDTDEPYPSFFQQMLETAQDDLRLLKMMEWTGEDYDWILKK